jgi:hypothetical protein
MAVGVAAVRHKDVPGGPNALIAGTLGELADKLAAQGRPS